MKLKTFHFSPISLLFLIAINTNAQLNNTKISFEDNGSYQGEVLHIQLEKELGSDPIMILPNNFPEIVEGVDNINFLITSESINNSNEKTDEISVDFIPLDPISGGGGTKPITIRPTDPDNGYIIYENVTYNVSNIRPSSIHQLQIKITRGDEVINFESPVLTVFNNGITHNVSVYPVPFRTTLNFDFIITKDQEPVSLDIITPSGIYSILNRTIYRRGRHTYLYHINYFLGKHLSYSLSIGTKTYTGNLDR